MQAIYVVGFNLAVACAFARSAVVLIGGIRSLLGRSRFEVVRFGLAEALTVGGVVIWCGLSLCFLSPAAAAVTALYVVPAYLLYMRSEEAMMLASFGERYGEYRRRVPMLVPRLRARQR